MRLPTTTYRLQLRNGVDFARGEALLPYFEELGISDLYLSPIFRAGSGSTHGYDVVDPTAIEEGLGGREGFERFARAARERGMGVILDIVPNHTAFSTENPWLRDVLRHGQESPWARHFDIDWSRGRLILPFLSAPFDERLEAGAIGLGEAPDGPVLTEGGLEIPLAPGPLPDPADQEAMRALHDRQAWQLVEWQLERDLVTHRRFFSITGLIGMRVEEQAVFEDTHRLIFDLVDEGLVTALRVDHIDGLADPAEYLRRLRDRVGDMPIWVEKILTGPERLPDWPIEGTTGYEVAQALARVLSSDPGTTRLRELYSEATGRTDTFKDILHEAKGEIIRTELAAELHQLIQLADRAATERGVMQGPEQLREAVLQYLIHFPQYRTYITDQPREEDRRIVCKVIEDAAAAVRFDATLRFLEKVLLEPEVPADTVFRTRLEQVTGAVMAKSHEDTAAFRHTRYLAANEVGAEPNKPWLSPEGFLDWITLRGETMPAGLSLTSSHDTKRSEDARMRIAAISHDPDAFLSIFEAAGRTPGAVEVDPNLRWYVCQALLAIWGEHGAVPDRLAQHVEKAMREAKEDTNWPFPDASAERPAIAWARRLARSWETDLPDGVRQLMALSEALAEVQLGLKMTIPGIPDIYQGCEIGNFYLTDPDNRLPVPFDRIAELSGEEFDARKLAMTRALATLRKERPAIFAEGRVEVVEARPDLIRFRRESGSESLEVAASLDPNQPLAELPDSRIWPPESFGRAWFCLSDGSAR